MAGPFVGTTGWALWPHCVVVKQHMLQQHVWTPLQLRMGTTAFEEHLLVLAARVCCCVANWGLSRSSDVIVPDLVMLFLPQKVTG